MHPVAISHSICYVHVSNQLPDLAGIGVFFGQQRNDGRVFIQNIVKGGSAERDGTVRNGDVLLSIENQSVQGASLSDLRNLILGAPGTFVELSFQRADGAGERTFSVRLMRGTPEFFAQMKVKTLMVDEMERLRQALAIAQEELHRLRAALQEGEAQSERDRGELESLRTTLDTADAQLKAAQGAVGEEQRRQRQLEAQLRQLQLQFEQEVASVERLRQMLRQAELQLRTAQTALVSAQERLRDEEAAVEAEVARRKEVEAREAALRAQISERESEVWRGRLGLTIKRKKSCGKRTRRRVGSWKGRGRSWRRGCARRRRRQLRRSGCGRS